MFKRLTIAEQAELLKAASLLEKYYESEHVKAALEVMGTQLDTLEEEGARLFEDSPRPVKMESTPERPEEPADMDNPQFELIQGPEYTKKEQEDEEDTEGMEIGGEPVQQKLFDHDSLPDLKYSKDRAQAFVRLNYGCSLDELLVDCYYRQGMYQREIAEKIFGGRTKQRTISTWLNAVPNLTKQRVLQRGRTNEQ